MAEAKPKILKPKSKKNVKSSREPIPTPVPSLSISPTIPTLSSPAHTAPILVIPISTTPPPSKSITHTPEFPTKNISKRAKVKATSRKPVKKMHEANTLVVLASAIAVAPLDTTSREIHANKEGKSENEVVTIDDKESDTEDKISEEANNSAEEKNMSEEEEVSESEGDDQENMGESEEVNDESEEDKGMRVRNLKAL
uniref:Uncharacterized protein n=1 Tax=Nicotiana tabacum TaxID=4097 RepID=A0A1S4C6W3_TOBAC|nr:PREDICTED: uncharacterized protein LOC107815718 [Nicotiana tabacum]